MLNGYGRAFVGSERVPLPEDLVVSRENPDMICSLALGGSTPKQQLHAV